MTAQTLIEELQTTLDALSMSLDSDIEVVPVDRPGPLPLVVTGTTDLEKLVQHALIDNFIVEGSVYVALMRRTPNQVLTALWHLSDNDKPAHRDDAIQMFLQSTLDQCIGRLAVDKRGSKNPTYNLVAINNRPHVDPPYMQLGSMFSVVIRTLVASGMLDDVDLSVYHDS